ncbi:hypothetical protein [Haloarchaeobius litoreus]|uniref:PD-(D/E)XK nuclease superfamily protein n=1 Tax=Haloarchaeobius litoreus TaxID=755306 RepID=A0ABD6DKP4_9EURY|nr:hypothetical protein [Haloarchaeobius litoreus]
MGRPPQYLRSIEGSEVAQNDLVAGILGESLRYGPEVLNGLHQPDFDGELVLSGDTELIAVQEKIDSQSEWELDWVFRDEDKYLIGYESKKGSSLSAKQLYNEAVELCRVATDEDVSLIIITDHSREPSIVADVRGRLQDEDLDIDIVWFSWDEFLSRVKELEPDHIQPQHEPLVSQLEQALSNEGYGEQFSRLLEFSEEEIERFKEQQDQLIGLIQDLDRLAPEVGLERYSSGRMEIYHWGGSKSLGTLTNSYNPLAPENIMVSFVPEGFSDHPEGRGTSSTYPGVHLHLFKPVIEVGIHLRPNKNEQHRQVLIESSEKFVSLAREYDLSLFSFWNSWGISNEHHNPEEIEEILTDNRLSADDGYKRLLFGKRINYQEEKTGFVKKILDHLELAFQFSWVENRELFYPGYNEE